MKFIICISFTHKIHHLHQFYSGNSSFLSVLLRKFIIFISFTHEIHHFQYEIHQTFLQYTYGPDDRPPPAVLRQPEPVVPISLRPPGRPKIICRRTIFTFFSIAASSFLDNKKTHFGPSSAHISEVIIHPNPGKKSDR